MIDQTAWTHVKTAVRILGAAALLAMNVQAGIAGDPTGVSPALGDPLAEGHSARIEAEDPIGIPPAVTTVQSGGAWTDGSSTGFYRVILVDHGFEHVVSSLYLQWLELMPAERAERVRLTATFKEINDMPVYSLAIKTFKPDDGSLEIRLSGFNSYSNEPQDFLVRAREPGSALLLRQK